MARTLASVIIASKSRQKAEEGEICQVKVDFAFVNDITGPPAVRAFRKMGAKTVFDPARCAFIPDHFTPNKDIAAAEQVKFVREFAKEQGIIYWEQGRLGVEHTILPEKGLILPGEIVIGADSHTCTGAALGAFATGVGSTDLAAIWALGETWLKVPETIRILFSGNRPAWICGKDLILEVLRRIGVQGARYKALQFEGDALFSIPLDDRFTVSNMAVEAGAKTGLFVPDEKTLEYANSRASRYFKPLYPDDGATYSQTVEIILDDLEPMVALPHQPSNVRTAATCEKNPINQVFIGSCTNGRLRDLEQADLVLKGREIHPDVRCIIIPSSPEVYQTALERGYISDFTKAGAVVCTPTCGPCVGGHMGVLAKGEKCVSTSNRNFLGRMGHLQSEVILAGPLVAAASALRGCITDPREVLSIEDFSLLEVKKNG